MKSIKPINNKFLAYVRVSSKDQEKGMSLDQQTEHIEKYAQSNGLQIIDFYGGTESAATMGRKEYGEMIEVMKKENYAGVIFHKADRSGRNPGDQGKLYELMMEGYEFHFVTEHLSTKDPVGKQTLYFAWAMASSFSENLKIEVAKGLNGMLKEGRSPIQAPIGYLDTGRGIKTIDPVRGTLIKMVFELYSTGNWTIEKLYKKVHESGLRRKDGANLDPKVLYKILRNPFYYGIIRYRNEDHLGSHEALVSKALFDKVQNLLDRKSFKHIRKFAYVFAQMLTCPKCGKPLRGMSAKKRYKYYSCRNKGCKVNLREESIEDEFLIELRQLEFDDKEVEMFLKAVAKLREDLKGYKANEIKHIDLELSKLKDENEKLLTLYLEQKISDSDYKLMKSKYSNKEIEYNERRVSLEKADTKVIEQITEIGTLLKKPSLAYRMASDELKQQLVRSLINQFSWNNGKPDPVWKNKYQIVANRPKVLIGSPTGNRTPI